MKDIIRALIAQTVATAEQATATTSQPASAAEPTTITKDNMLELLEASPSILHTAQLGSVERFFAHQHLHNLSPPKNRVRRLEKNLSIKKAAAEAKETRRLKEREGPAVPSVKVEREDDEDIVMLSDSQHTKGLSGLSRPNGSQYVIMDALLESELFPELPPTAKPEGTPTRKLKAPIIDITSSEDEIELSKLVNSKPKAAKEEANGKDSKKKGKGKEVEDKPERGRFGVWKLLSSILEAHSPGQAATALHHRSPHYGFQRGHSHR